MAVIYTRGGTADNVLNVAWRIESLIANNNQSFKTGRPANFYLCQLHGCLSSFRSLEPRAETHLLSNLYLNVPNYE